MKNKRERKNAQQLCTKYNKVLKTTAIKAAGLIAEQ